MSTRPRWAMLGVAFVPAFGLGLVFGGAILSREASPAPTGTNASAASVTRSADVSAGAQDPMEEMVDLCSRHMQEMQPALRRMMGEMMREMMPSMDDMMR